MNHRPGAYILPHQSSANLVKRKVRKKTEAITMDAYVVEVAE